MNKQREKAEWFSLKLRGILERYSIEALPDDQVAGRYFDSYDSLDSPVLITRKYRRMCSKPKLLAGLSTTEACCPAGLPASEGAMGKLAKCAPITSIADTGDAKNAI